MKKHIFLGMMVMELLTFSVLASSLDVITPSRAFEERMESSLVGIAEIKITGPQNYKAAYQNSIKTMKQLQVNGVLEVKDILIGPAIGAPKEIPFEYNYSPIEFSGKQVLWKYPVDLGTFEKARVLFRATQGKGSPTWELQEVTEPTPEMMAAISLLKKTTDASFNLSVAQQGLKDPATTPLESAILTRWIVTKGNSAEATTQAIESALNSKNEDLVLLGFGLAYRSAGANVESEKDLNTTLLTMALGRMASAPETSSLRKELLGIISGYDLRGIQNNPAWSRMLLDALKNAGPISSDGDDEDGLQEVVKKLTAVVDAKK